MQETGLAFLHMDFNANGPTFVGDTIHVECEVLQARPTSKGHGLVRTHNRIVTQRNETVIEYTPLRMVAGRSDAART
jgi:acyl dehydratase